MKSSLLKATMINVLIGICLALMLTGCQSNPCQGDATDRVECAASVPSILGFEHSLHQTDAAMFHNDF